MLLLLFLAILLLLYFSSPPTITSLIYNVLTLCSSIFPVCAQIVLHLLLAFRRSLTRHSQHTSLSRQQPELFRLLSLPPFVNIAIIFVINYYVVTTRHRVMYQLLTLNDQQEFVYKQIHVNKIYLYVVLANRIFAGSVVYARLNFLALLDSIGVDLHEAELLIDAQLGLSDHC